MYALAIVFGVARRQTSSSWPASGWPKLVADGGYHIQTGFAGTPFVTDALTLTGHLDDAYRLLLQTECPSWLYPVTMGATTIWERWDSMLPDGTINPGQMTSFNHYALGAVADWMHRTIGGIAPLEPGLREVLVAPQPGGGITWAGRPGDAARPGRGALARLARTAISPSIWRSRSESRRWSGCPGNRSSDCPAGRTISTADPAHPAELVSTAKPFNRSAAG